MGIFQLAVVTNEITGFLNNHIGNGLIDSSCNQGYHICKQTDVHPNYKKYFTSIKKTVYVRKH